MIRFRKPTERERDWLAVIAIMPLYVLLLSLMQEERALFFSMAVLVFYVAISRKWERRRDAKFWIAISLLAAIHIIVLSAVKLPHYSGPGMVIAFPFVFGDGLAMYGIFYLFDKQFPPSAT